MMTQPNPRAADRSRNGKPGAAVGGRVTMGTITDVAPLLRHMLLEAKQRAGAEGAAPTTVSAAELDAAAQAFGAELDAHGAEAAEQVRETMERSLPRGVRIERVDAQRVGTRVTSTTTFSFDDVRALPALDVFFERGRPSQRPFAGLRIEVDAAAVVVDGMPPPLSLPDASADAADDEGAALRLELELPLAVLEHNATRAEAGRLTWDIGARRLRARGPDDTGWIRARFGR